MLAARATGIRRETGRQAHVPSLDLTTPRSGYLLADAVTSPAFRALDRRRPPVSVISGARNRSARRIAEVLPRRTVLRVFESEAAS